MRITVLHMPVTLFLAALIIHTALLTGCDPFTDDEYREYIVVESHLIAGNDLPVVLLTRTTAIDQQYSFQESAVEDAEVTIHLLDDQNEEVPQTSFSYRMMQNPGVYRPDNFIMHKVLPRRTYMIEAEIPGGETLRATTTVPDDFQVIDYVREPVVYRDTLNPLRITISKSFNSGRQNTYILNTISSDPSFENITPGYQAQIDDDDDLFVYSNHPSPIINEAVFQQDPDNDDNLVIRYPWIGAVFYGVNRVVINSLDRNISDFLRSQEVQLGGSTLSPGEIPNAIYHIEGGIGVFGSASTDTIVTYIEEPPPE